MGNCLASQEKAIKVMKTDGQVLEYKAPMKVYQVLSEYVGHAISDALPVVHHLRRDADMIGGQLYFLLPLPPPSLKFDKVRIQHSSPKLVEGEDSSGVLRIKLVISKQELEAMMRKGGISAGDLVSKFQEIENSKRPDEGKENCTEGWKPVLESIPELE